MMSRARKCELYDQRFKNIYWSWQIWLVTSVKRRRSFLTKLSYMMSGGSFV